MNADEANAALDAVTQANRSLAAVSAAPLWRHAAFGLVMALLMLSAALDHRLRLVPWLASMVGVGLLVWWDRRQTGMFVNGYRRGRTLPLTIALLVAMLALAVAAVRLSASGEPLLAFLTVPVAFVIALVTSLWWERIFLRELDAGR